MLCQNCKKKIANVHIVKSVNNKKVEMYLCEDCAKLNGVNTVHSNGLNNLFYNLMGYDDKAIHSEEDICKGCGMEFSEFSKTGRIGCAKCYDTFRNKIEVITQRLQGNLKHIGKSPFSNSTEEIKEDSVEREDELKKKLKIAIDKENYEEAAQIRDEIRAIEGGAK